MTSVSGEHTGVTLCYGGDLIHEGLEPRETLGGDITGAIGPRSRGVEPSVRRSALHLTTVPVRGVEIVRSCLIVGRLVRATAPAPLERREALLRLVLIILHSVSVNRSGRVGEVPPAR